MSQALASQQELEELIDRLTLWAADRAEIDALYLFGSQVQGRTHAASDVDVAVLARTGYLDAGYADTMSDMVSLRNRLVHLYWDVDVERVYSYLQTDVAFLKDFRDFALELLSAEEEEQAEENEQD